MKRHSFNDVEREDYTSAMIAVYELQDLNPVIDLYVFSYFRTCALYDTTVKAMGFDEVRVRFRQERRAAIRSIILELKVGQEIKQFVTAYSARLPEEYRAAFYEDVLEDIAEIGPSRIAGLGITDEDLDAWLHKASSST